MIQDIATARRQTEPLPGPSACEHRTVAKDGRIVCSKIVQGKAEVSPNTCRICPFKAIDCAHLRFSLEQTDPRLTVARYNGQTVAWNDDPPEIHLGRAICAARGMSIAHPRQCAGCTLRQPAADSTPRPTQQRVVAGNKMILFPRSEVQNDQE
jgi:hypothetical protein